MKYLFSIILLIFCCYDIYAQVGVNTNDPQALLEIRTSNTSAPQPTDGLLIPKVDEFPGTNPSASQDAMLVYLTTTDGTDSPDFYYWNNSSTSWLPLSGSSIESINDLTNGKSDDDGTNDGSSIFLGIGAGTNDDSNNRRNIGVGYNSLLTNTTGSDNVGVGYETIRVNTSGQRNIGIGYRSLYANTTGASNIGIGYRALFSTTTVSYNIGIGYESLFANTSGDQNIALGYRALTTNTTGESNVYRMYTSGWTNVSDRNLKHSITEVPIGLDFVSQLRPVEFIYNNAKNGQKTYGFIAQEVRQSLRDQNIEDDIIVVPFDEQYLGMKQIELIPVLTKAIQEQQQEIEELKQEVERLKNLESRIKKLEKALKLE